MIALQNRGSAALDERFNHIDIEHFKKGERGRDWCLPLSGESDVLMGGAESIVHKSEVAGTPSLPEGKRRKRKFSG